MDRDGVVRYIDLHTHSACSDGSMSPRAVVALAREAGLSAIALTDHDTVDGVDKAKAAGAEYGVEVIAGVELVAEYKGSEIHILGYFIDYQGSYFTQKLAELKLIRKERNERLVQRLGQMKMPVSFAELEELSQGRQVTRMHFAKLLYEKGYVASIREAFQRYLAEGQPAYVGRNAFTFAESIEAIQKSGGQAVLAHPFAYKWQGGEVTAMIEALTQAGLDGIEAIYPLFDRQQTRQLLKTAQRLGLKITGGSDFHGENKPDIQIGTGKGNIQVTYDILEKLRG